MRNAQSTFGPGGSELGAIAVGGTDAFAAGHADRELPDNAIGMRTTAVLTTAAAARRYTVAASPPESANSKRLRHESTVNAADIKYREPDYADNPRMVST